MAARRRNFFAEAEGVKKADGQTLIPLEISACPGDVVSMYATAKRRAFDAKLIFAFYRGRSPMSASIASQQGGGVVRRRKIRIRSRNGRKEIIARPSMNSRERAGKGKAAETSKFFPNSSEVAGAESSLARRMKSRDWPGRIRNFGSYEDMEAGLLPWRSSREAQDHEWNDALVPEQKRYSICCVPRRSSVNSVASQQGGGEVVCAAATWRICST